jgi:hypothetical protein
MVDVDIVNADIANSSTCKLFRRNNKQNRRSVLLAYFFHDWQKVKEINFLIKGKHNKAPNFGAFFLQNY